MTRGTDAQKRFALHVLRPVSRTDERKAGRMDALLEREVNLLHANICQALADPKRILILYALDDGPRCVHELAEALAAPQSTVSRHLKVLRERSLVSAERSGSSVRYSLADRRVIAALDALREVLVGSLARQAELARSLA